MSSAGKGVDNATPHRRRAQVTVGKAPIDKMKERVGETGESYWRRSGRYALRGLRVDSGHESA